MSSAAPAKRPCGSCPYRQDVPSGIWAAEEYAKLPAYDRDTAQQPPVPFLCHQQNGHLCAGWVGCHDMTHSLGLRMALRTGLVADDALDHILDYSTDVPLWDSGAAAAEHGMADVEHVGEQAARVIDRLTRKAAAR